MSSSASSIPSPPHPLASQPRLRAVLDRLHAISLEQERALSARHSHFPKAPEDNSLFQEQMVALDEDKAKAMYLILRMMGARRVVEAGTSYGVSLLWILASVLSNDRLARLSDVVPSLPALVIGTEKEPSKAAHALAHVREAFGELPAALTLLEGDLLLTLPAANIPDRSIDALLVDIWAPVALPTLKILLAKLRVGAVVFIDNTDASKERYAELLGFLRGGTRFECTTLPYLGGFDVCVYTGEPDAADV